MHFEFFTIVVLSINAVIFLRAVFKDIWYNRKQALLITEMSKLKMDRFVVVQDKSSVELRQHEADRTRHTVNVKWLSEASCSTGLGKPYNTKICQVCTKSFPSPVYNDTWKTCNRCYDLVAKMASEKVAEETQVLTAKNQSLETKLIAAEYAKKAKKVTLVQQEEKELETIVRMSNQYKALVTSGEITPEAQTSALSAAR